MPRSSLVLHKPLPVQERHWLRALGAGDGASVGARPGPSPSALFGGPVVVPRMPRAARHGHGHASGSRVAAVLEAYPGPVFSRCAVPRSAAPRRVAPRRAEL